MVREPHRDDEPTLMRRAVDYTDQLAKWPKRVAGVVWLLGALGALGFWVPAGLRVLKGFGPLDVLVRDHIGDFKEHVKESTATVRVIDEDLHTIIEQFDVVQGQLGTVIERLDTISTEQRWLDCVRLRDREMEAGVPPRDCRPFGGSP